MQIINTFLRHSNFISHNKQRNTRKKNPTSNWSIKEGDKLYSNMCLIITMINSCHSSKPPFFYTIFLLYVFATIFFLFELNLFMQKHQWCFVALQPFSYIWSLPLITICSNVWFYHVISCHNDISLPSKTPFTYINL